MRNRSISLPTEFKADSSFLPNPKIGELIAKEAERLAIRQAEVTERWLRAVGADPTKHQLMVFNGDNFLSRTLVLIPNEVAATRGIGDRAWLEANCPTLQLVVDVIPPIEGTHYARHLH